MNRGFIAQAVWEQRCTCPGTEQARRNLGEPRRDHSDFAGFRERARHERQEQRAARDEAFDEARAGVWLAVPGFGDLFCHLHGGTSMI
jgi:hypothetical protein